MTHSATGGREAKRLETSQRIVHEAAELTRDRGLDGWTMHDLAAAAEVSRRTLFNYFSSKIDAVIGPMPELPEEALAAFRAGGPTGDLLDDARVVVHALLDADGVDLDHRTATLRREILVAHPRLLLVVHERFEEISAAMAEHVLVRDPALGVARARLFVRLLCALFDGCVQELGSDVEPRPLTEAFDDAVADARLLLA
ncbi:MAG: TetR/AcrR family transcriptional regulator [Nocardioides sp.]|nr:TetR/AcrR family transcriptional regulator [Nocardioides sp.]